MANYLCIYPAPDSHIEFICAHPESLWQYVEGQRPNVSESKQAPPSVWQHLAGMFRSAPGRKVPVDWPSGERKPIGPEINHRNVELHHLILNGTAELVDGSGSIFQTWFAKSHSAIDITGDRDYFAFKSNKLPALAELALRIDGPTVKVRFTQWLRNNGDRYEPSDEECNEIAKEYQSFAESLREAVHKGYGLIWVSQ